MRGYYNGCDQVLVPSELTRRHLLTYGVRAPIAVLPTGIPTPPPGLPSPAEVRRRWDIPPGSPLFLYVGRLAPEKNLETLLRAFARIVQARPDARLLLAGSGMGEAATQQAAQQLGIAERTVFTGFLDRAQLDPLYAAADVFLFPSKTETQGLAVGEAMACGTPCVVVNAGGAPESVRDGVDGFLVDDDPAQMAERALRLLEDAPLRRRMSAAARAHAATMTPEKVAGRIIALYEELMTAGQKRTEVWRRKRWLQAETACTWDAALGVVQERVEGRGDGVGAVGQVGEVPGGAGGEAPPQAVRPPGVRRQKRPVRGQLQQRLVPAVQVVRCLLSILRLARTQASGEKI